MQELPPHPLQRGCLTQAAPVLPGDRHSRHGREPCSCTLPARRLKPQAHHSGAQTAPHHHLCRQLGGGCTGNCRQSAHGIICPSIPVAVLVMLTLKIACAWENFVRHVCHFSSTPFPKHEKSSLMSQALYEDMFLFFFFQSTVYTLAH